MMRVLLECVWLLMTVKYYSWTGLVSVAPQCFSYNGMLWHIWPLSKRNCIPPVWILDIVMSTIFQWIVQPECITIISTQIFWFLLDDRLKSSPRAQSMTPWHQTDRGRAHMHSELHRFFSGHHESSSVTVISHSLCFNRCLRRWEVNTS